jgi:hypothetical protein
LKDPTLFCISFTGLKVVLRLYSWAKKYVTIGKKRISLEELRKVLGLDSVKNVDRNII